MDTSKVILCGANSYEQKYYFNEEFAKIPESIQEELHIICVLFTEEVGGAFMIGFDEDGSVMLITDANEDDILYDEIGAGLLVKEVQKRKSELFESLEMFYKAFIDTQNGGE
ncbi:MAG: hypothetical protein IJI23_05280 [Lachnospiraceae bacterium]|nr:hypothetical protein [Lachnospiraceae bacterium]